jgi:integrase
MKILSRLFFRHPRNEETVDDMRFSETPNIEPMQGCDVLLRLIPLYLESRADKDCSSRTISNCVYHLQPFEIWLSEAGPTCGWELSPDSFRLYARWLRDGSYLTRYGNPPSHNSRSAYLKRLRHLLSWCHKAGYIDGDASDWVPQLPQKPREMRPIDTSTIVNLLMACETGGRENLRPRNKALIAISFATGARREEICEILIRNVSFFDDGSGTIYLQKTKGDKPRTVIFGPSSGKILKLYMDSLPSGRERLFTVHPESLWRAVSALVNRANVPNSNLNDHRKFFASYWYMKYPEEDSPDKFVLDLQLGHASRTIQHRHYVFMNTESIRNFYISPMEDPVVTQYVSAL